MYSVFLVVVVMLLLGRVLCLFMSCRVLLFLYGACSLLLLCVCSLLWYCATLTEVFFRAFSSVVRQMSGYNSTRRGTAHTSQFPLTMYFMYGLFVNESCDAATGCQPNCG